MTTGKPGAVAMEAAVAVAKRYVEFAEAESETSLSLNDLAAIIQAAIDREKAAVVAERNQANADADEACKWQSRLTTQRDDALDASLALEVELGSARAAARELGGYGFHKFGCPGSHPKGACSCGWDETRAKHAALLAEPEGERMSDRIYPDEMTEDIEFILGMQNFQACPMAHLFRAAGADIPRKVEAEQAFVTHWLLKLILDHGAGWRDEAEAHMEEARAALKRTEPQS